MNPTPSNLSPTGADYSPTEPSPKTPVPPPRQPQRDPFTASPTFSTPPTAMNRTILNSPAITPEQAMAINDRDASYSGVYPLSRSHFYHAQGYPTAPPVRGPGNRAQTRQFGASYTSSPLRQVDTTGAAVVGMFEFLSCLYRSAITGGFFFFVVTRLTKKSIVYLPTSLVVSAKVEGLRGQNSGMARAVPPGMQTVVPVAARVFSPSSAAVLFGSVGAGVSDVSGRRPAAAAAASAGSHGLPSPRIPEGYQPPKGMYQARLGRWAEREAHAERQKKEREEEKAERLARIVWWRKEQDEDEDEEEEKDEDEVIFTGRRGMRRC